MSAHPVLGKVLVWASVGLGAPSLGGVVYFGIEVVRIWGRPAAEVQPVRTVEDGFSLGTAVLGAIGEGIAKGLFATSLGVFAVAVVLFFVGRRLRQGES